MFVFYEFGFRMFVMAKTKKSVDSVKCAQKLVVLPSQMFNIWFGNNVCVPFPFVNWTASEMKVWTFLFNSLGMIFFIVKPLNFQIHSSSLGGNFPLPYATSNAIVLLVYFTSITIAWTVVIGGHRETNVTIPNSHLAMLV